MPTQLERHPWRCYRPDARSGSILKFHRHNEAELTFLHSGRLVCQMNGKAVTLLSGQLSLFWGGIPHRWLEWSDDLSFKVICLPMDFVVGLGLPPSFLSSLLHGKLLVEKNPEEKVMDEILMSKWEDGLGQKKTLLPAICRLEIEARLRRLALNETPSRTSHRCASDALSRLLAVLSASATDGEAVDALAAQAGLHPKYAMRLFKKECGITILAYLHQLRIGHAQRLLVTTDHKITDVVLECGFSSNAQFFSVFKRMTGCSPSQYRK
ncbi:MAG: helix-turn-helix domain-containing protein, partial [Saprospiraceae bacterium]